MERRVNRSRKGGRKGKNKSEVEHGEKRKKEGGAETKNSDIAIDGFRFLGREGRNEGPRLLDQRNAVGKP
ncbi:unnamed protein product [Dovyalis caffra]|uniref:Uncharacterized protein n=1 Tax=Dovyalis caffra TaxID=77055 RepID=A0AAV1R7D0_9ROSI|nr:unnamed protein product [Dovyalis caffra]